MTDDIGERFWAETKHRREALDHRELDWDARPETYKEYGNVRTIHLRNAPAMTPLSFEEVVRARRSGRTYGKESLSMEEISYLIFTSTGIDLRERGREFRTVPSAGALYPIETYLCVNRVEGLEPGLYHYAVRRHELELLRPGEIGPRLAKAALDQDMVADSAVTFIWTSVFARSRWKYGERCYRYVHLDAGHIGQNLALAAAALRLGACHIAAFYDDEVNGLIGIDGKEESAIYLTSVGRLR